MLILSLWYFLQQKIETLSHKDKNLLLLVEMGFSTEEAASAVDRCGVYLPFSVTFVFSFAHFHWQTIQKKKKHFHWHHVQMLVFLFFYSQLVQCWFVMNNQASRYDILLHSPLLLLILKQQLLFLYSVYF